MTENATCPECGRDLEPGFPSELCPDCLLKAGIQNVEEASEPAFAETIQTPPGGPGSGSAGMGAIVNEPPPTPEELNQLLPQLEVLELLGAGGMGAVYKARQKSLDRIVALKMIKSQLIQVGDFADRFTREAQALARLNHPNIVGVHDFGQVNGQFYLIMEYVDGTDLRHLIASKEITPVQALQIVPQICDALQYAHDQGIVHRDIKPENILVDQQGKIRIADFGLAKLLDDSPQQLNLTSTHQVMGTIKYMAPEQMEGAASIDHRADIYSLGVVFYELLTGEIPLGRFAAPSEKVPVDQRIDNIVMRALERELPQRYQHASDMGLAVEELSNSDIPIEAHAVGPAISPNQSVPQYPSDYDLAVRQDSAVRRDSGQYGSSPQYAGYDSGSGTGAGSNDSARYTPPNTGDNSPTNPAWVAPEYANTRMHVKVIAAINIAFSSLFLGIAVLVMVVLPGIGFLSGEAEATTVLGTIATIGFTVLTLIALPGLLTGIGLWRFRWWSRYAAIILALINILNFPIGTILSVYTCVVLLSDDAGELFKDT